MREDFNSSFSSLSPAMFAANLIIPYISISIGYTYSSYRNKIREKVPLIDHLPKIGGAFLLSVIVSYIISCIVYFNIHVASSGTSIIGFSLAMYFAFLITFNLIYTATHLKRNGRRLSFFVILLMLFITDAIFFYFFIIPGYFFASIHWAGLIVFMPLVCLSFIYHLASKS
jgi:glucan phosphoethanolaminetransferase (alkaline phosphatase superfamily)